MDKGRTALSTLMRRRAPSPDDASHRSENGAGPAVASILRDTSRLLRCPPDPEAVAKNALDLPPETNSLLNNNALFLSGRYSIKLEYGLLYVRLAPIAIKHCVAAKFPDAHNGRH